MFSFCVEHGETRAARRRLGCALDAARFFSQQPLRVLIAGSGAPIDALDAEFANFDALQQERILAAVSEAAKQNNCQTPLVELVQGEVGALASDVVFVTETMAAQRHDFHVLHPANEQSLSRRAGAILLPFSDGDTGLTSAAVAFELAERWRAQRVTPDNQPEVILYHTTWKDPDAVSANPLDHMCGAARRVMLTLERVARERGIVVETVIETHDDVVQGLVEISQLRQTSLIVMARGARIRQGSYVNRTVTQSSVPILVVGDQTAAIGKPAPDAELNAFKKRRRTLAADALTEEKTTVSRRFLSLPLLRKPMFVVAVVAVSYLLKAIAKIAIGLSINSPMVTGDGFHNIADLVQAAAVAAALLIASRPTGGRYPYGRKNVEWFTSIGIGLLLLGAAGKFVFDCVVGALSYWHAGDAAVRAWLPWLPQPEALHLDGRTFPIVLAVTALSFLASVAISRYQIAVGRRSGSASLIAGGEEMASDGWIEAVTVCGIIVEFATGWRFLEYPLGIFVACMIVRTACELITAGWRVLLQHTIGIEHEAALRKACLSVCAVEDVRELKTFQVGHTAVVLVTIESLLDDKRGSEYLQKAVEDAIRAYLLQPHAEFKSADVRVTMVLPDRVRHRVGYALVGVDGRYFLAPTAAQATCLAVCDVEHQTPERTKVLPVDGSLVALLLDKRIRDLFVFKPTSEECEQIRREALERLGASGDLGIVPVPNLVQSNCYVPALCGLVL